MTRAAGLPRDLQLVYHPGRPVPQAIPLEEVYADLDFPDGRGALPYVVLNMVQTLDGAATLGGHAWTIGTDVDHYLYRTLHAAVDAVIVGAGTLRQEDAVAGTHAHLRARRTAAGRPPSPTAVVLTARAAFPPEVFQKRFFTRTDFPSLVVTTPRAAEEDVERLRAAGVEVAVVRADPEGRVDVSAALAFLQERGFRRVEAEGGPRLATALVRRSLVGELFLTVALRLAGIPEAPRILLEPPPGRFELLSAYHYVDASRILREVYLRFRLEPAPS